MQTTHYSFLLSCANIKAVDLIKLGATDACEAPNVSVHLSL